MLVVIPTLQKLVTLHALADQLSQKFQTTTVTEEDLKTIGLQLWESLSLDENSTPLTLIIESDQVQVQSLPWECLYHPKLGFLAKHPDATLSRRLLNFHSQPVGSTPLRILLFTTQPSLIQNLAPEIDQQYVRTALAPWIRAGWVELYAPDDGRFVSLVKLLRTHLWHVVLLAGHSWEATGWLFENETGGGEIVTANCLTQAFKQSNVPCVVVATCHSDKLARQLVQAGIPQVVGMRETLVDRAGSVFVQAFCKTLADQHPVAVAVQRGRQAMQNLLQPDEIWAQGDPSVGQWSLPILFCQNPSQALLHWQLPQPRPAPWSGSQVELPQLFIGRRRELRVLGEAFASGEVTRLWISGPTGLGKTALGGQLMKTMIELGYRIVVYQKGDNQSLPVRLAQAVDLSPTRPWQELVDKLAKGRWVVWLDNLDETILEYLAILSPQENLRILLTSRYPKRAIRDFYEYEITALDYPDFLRYLRYLGLTYASLQEYLIYRMLEGNFKGIQLLRSLPTGKPFIQQLTLVKRYLQASRRWEETA